MPRRLRTLKLSLAALFLALAPRIEAQLYKTSLDCTAIYGPPEVALSRGRAETFRWQINKGPLVELLPLGEKAIYVDYLDGIAYSMALVIKGKCAMPLHSFIPTLDHLLSYSLPIRVSDASNITTLADRIYYRFSTGAYASIYCGEDHATLTLETPEFISWARVVHLKEMRKGSKK